MSFLDNPTIHLQLQADRREDLRRAAENHRLRRETPRPPRRKLHRRRNRSG
jgi:hypothetical protein